MSLAILKKSLRSDLPPPSITAADFGKLAERVRRLRGYASCRQLFVSPVAALWQVRINALLDQKELILPSGGLKQGFVRFKPNSIPFNQLAHAVSFKGMEKFGERLTTKGLEKLKIDLLLVDSEAVDLCGGRLGDGLGLTDLAIAILQDCGAISTKARLFSLASENRILADKLPVEPWDITLNGVITLAETEYFPDIGSDFPTIHWQTLLKKRIRKIQPLWDLLNEDSKLLLISTNYICQQSDIMDDSR